MHRSASASVFVIFLTCASTAPSSTSSGTSSKLWVSFSCRCSIRDVSMALAAIAVKRRLIMCSCRLCSCMESKLSSSTPSTRPFTSVIAVKSIDRERGPRRRSYIPSKRGSSAILRTKHISPSRTVFPSSPPPPFSAAVRSRVDCITPTSRSRSLADAARDLRRDTPTPHFSRLSAKVGEKPGFAADPSASSSFSTRFCLASTASSVISSPSLFITTLLTITISS
mmetsp:Transcript_25516/g.63887  ORF Transcript_25516/g.63887 Transcript_25516/m.63887 type:complete len:225 (-) Transcript_25516:1963-2637(-)